MSTPEPHAATVYGPQAVAVATADWLLASVGLPTYSDLARRLPQRAPETLPAGVASLDAARADREQARRLEGRL